MVRERDIAMLLRERDIARFTPWPCTMMVMMIIVVTL